MTQLSLVKGEVKAPFVVQWRNCLGTTPMEEYETEQEAIDVYVKRLAAAALGKDLRGEHRRPVSVTSDQPIHIVQVWFTEVNEDDDIVRSFTSGQIPCDH